MSSIAGEKVHARLAKHYPPHVIAWVRPLKWSKRRVPLADVQIQPRPGHPVDTGKVGAIRATIRAGKPLKPVVLVHNGVGKLKIADGYHRLEALRREGVTAHPAYVGRARRARGPWSRAMHDAKLNV